MNLKEKWKAIKKEFSIQKEESKAILKSKWEIGAEQGKALKDSHKEKVVKLVKKDEDKSKR